MNTSKLVSQDAAPAASLVEAVEYSATTRRVLSMVGENLAIMSSPAAILLASQHLSHPGVSALAVLGGVAAIGVTALISVSQMAKVMEDGEQFACPERPRPAQSAIGEFVGAIAAHRQRASGLKVDISHDKDPDTTMRTPMWRPPL